ncbi:unnamed protein product [Lymnaea stagnalis]|uniref:G-protein coupled receptors family 1 profile domain-containing protein n=1 Tax=Lymnaea stagnalis TaxID=6523 RepID=A0AAV2HLS3_LYMST
MEGEACDEEKWPQLVNMSTEELWVFMEDEERLEAVKKIPTFLLLSGLMLVGLPGNVLVLLVYGLRFPASTTKCFIMAMAAFDFMNCAVGMPFEMVDLKRDIDLDIPIPCKIFRFLVTLSSCGSVTVLVVVSLDRFRRICRPFQKQMTVRQSKFIIGGMLLLSLAFSTPALVLYGRRTDTRFNHTVYECSIDDAYRNSRMAFWYQIILGVTWVVCIMILVIMYSFIVYNIRKQKQRRQQLASNSYGSQSVLNKIKISITDTSNNEGLRGAPLRTEIIAVSDDHVLTCSRSGDAAIYAVNSPNDGDEVPGKEAMSRLVDAVREQDEKIFRSTAESRRSVNSSSERRRSKKRSSETSRSITRSSNASGSVKRSSETSRSVKRLFSRDANPLFQEDEDGDDAASDDNGTSFGDDVSLTGSNKVSTNVTKSSLNNYLAASMDTGFTLRSGSYCREESVTSQPDVIPTRARKRGHFFGRYRPWDSMGVACQTRVVSTMMDRDWTSNSFPLLDCPETHMVPIIRRASSLPCLLNLHGRKSDESGFEDFSEIQIPEAETRLKEGTPYEAKNHINSAKQRTSSLVSQSVSKNPHANVTWDSIHDNSLTLSRTSKTSQVSANRQTPNGFRSQSVATTATSKSRKKSCVRDIKTSRVSFMMFLVTLGFVLSYLPHLVLQVFGVLSPPWLVERLLCPRSGYYITHHLLMRSFFINNAINPIIYSFYNKTFRARCLRILKSPKSLLKASTNDFGVSVSQDNDTS